MGAEPSAEEVERRRAAVYRRPGFGCDGDYGFGGRRDGGVTRFRGGDRSGDAEVGERSGGEERGARGGLWGLGLVGRVWRGNWNCGLKGIGSEGQRGDYGAISQVGSGKTETEVKRRLGTLDTCRTWWWPAMRYCGAGLEKGRGWAGRRCVRVSVCAHQIRDARAALRWSPARKAALG